MRRLQLAAVLFFCSYALHAQSFRNPYRIATPVDPLSVVAGDLNGDGVPDLIYGTGSYAHAALHPLLAQGGRAYSPGQDVSLPATISSECILADLNADKKLDLICMGFGVSNVSVQVAVLLGNGDGTFQPAAIVPLPSGSENSTLYPAVVGDINNDGHLDVIVTDGANDQIFPLLGDGAGHLTPAPVLFSTGGADHAALADLDGDGNQDLVVQGIQGNDVEVFKGHGDGTFDSGTVYPGNSAAILADVDGDGHPDLIGGGNGILRILHGNADGTFAQNPIATVDYTDGSNVGNKTGDGSYVSAYMCLDLNGDGIPDVLALGDDGLTVILGLPGLQFAKPMHYPVAQDFFLIGDFNHNLFLDLDGDGHPDFVAAGPNGIYITYGQPGGSFLSGSVYEAGYIVNQAAVADFNSDGIPDVVTSGDLQLQLSLGRGDGSFQTATPIAGTVRYTRSYSGSIADATIVHGDFNGDGQQDVLTIASPAQSAPAAPFLFFGHGDGSFASPVTVTNPAVKITAQAAVADLNGDGKDDIASSDGTTLTVNLSNGDGTFRTVTTALTPITGDYASQTVSFADLNGDGLLDLIYTTSNDVAVMTGRGDGTFNAAVFYPIPAIPGAYFRSPGQTAIGDFDGDGRLDIAVLVPYLLGTAQVIDSPSQIFSFYRQGSPTNLDASSFTAAVAGPVSLRSYTDFFAADLDGDGKTDVIADDDGNGYDIDGGNAIGVFHGMANRTFGPESTFVAGSGLQSLAITDLNQDGRPDLLASNGDFNAVANSFTVLLNELPALTAPVAKMATTTTAAVSPNPSTYGQPVIFTAHVSPATSTGLIPTGTVLFVFCRGATERVTLDATGTASFISPTGSEIAEPVGSCSFTATYQGDANFLPSTSPAEAYVVTPTPSTTTLSAQPDPAYSSQSVSFQATVHGVPSPTADPVTGKPIPPGVLQLTGTVRFLDGSTVLGSVPVNNSAATFTTNSLSVGTHNIIAVYSGDTNVGGSSGSASETVLPSTFTLSLSPGTLSLQTGKSGSVLVTLTSVGAYTGMLALTYSALPNHVSGSFSSVTVALPAAGNGASTLSLATALVSAAPAENRNHHVAGAMLLPVALIGFALCALCMRRSRLPSLLLASFASVLLAGAIGCSTVKDPLNLIAPGAYTIPVTATNPLTHDTQSANLTLLITP